MLLMIIDHGSDDDVTEDNDDDEHQWQMKMMITVANGNDGVREIGPVEEKTGWILKEDRTPLHQVALRKTHTKTGWLEKKQFAL